MMNFIANGFANRKRRGFTLVELLVVIVVLAILAAIVLPKFVGASTRSKESALKANLKMLRDSVSRYQSDTGLYPLTLADLAATTAPTQGNNGTTDTAITASDWHGPYIQEVPTDPINGAAFSYTKTTGAVKSSATGYTTW